MSRPFPDAPVSADPPSRSWLRGLFGIAAVGLLLRVFVLWTIPTQPISDFWWYSRLAQNLAAEGRYEAIRGRPDASFPPAYPLLLAGALTIFPDDPVPVGKLVNTLLGIATILLGGFLARRLWGERAGLLAALCFALWPRSLLMACLIASENLFSPLLLLFVLLLVRGAAGRRPMPLAAAAGIVVGLLALTRTVAYLFGFLWLLAALAAGRKLRHAVAQTVLVLLLQHAVMLPWALRNEERFGRFTFLNTAGGYGIFLGNNPNATGEWYDGRKDLERVAPGVLARGEFAISDASNAAARDWILSNPVRAAILYARKIWIIFSETSTSAGFAIFAAGVNPPWPGLDSLPGDHPLEKHPRLVHGVLALSGWLLIALALAGCAALIARAVRTRAPADRAAAVVFPAAAAYIPAVSAIVAVNGRYRWPVEDLLIPVAAFFVSWLNSTLRRSTVEPQPVATPMAARQKRRVRLGVWEWAALACAAGILVYQLFLPPIVGLADNGDFEKVMWPAGLEHVPASWDQTYFSHVRSEYRLAPPDWWYHYFSSEIPLARLARDFWAVLQPGRLFDIRAMALLHSSLLLFGLALILRSGGGLAVPARAALGALLVFVYTDVAYAATFNSFYSATASLLFFLCLAGIAAQIARDVRPSRALWAGYAAAAILFITSKPQETALAPFLAVLPVLWSLGSRPRRLRAATVIALLLVMTAAAFYRAAPTYLKEQSLYHALFQEMLPHSPAPGRDLRDLGLLPEWQAYAGTHAFQKESPIRDPWFRRELLSKFGRRQIVLFYLARPDRLAALFARSARVALRTRPKRLGNFEARSGAAPGTRSRAFSSWSGLKASLAPTGIWLLPMIFLGSLGGAAIAYRRSVSQETRRLALAVGMLALMTATEFAVCVIGEGGVDLTRHLFSFHAMLDLLLITGVVAVVAAATPVFQRRRGRTANLPPLLLARRGI